MGDPKGKLVTPVLENPDDELRSPECDADDNLKVNIASPTTHIVKPHADEKVFGFESVVIDKTSKDSTSTSMYIDSTEVPANKIWVITHIAVWNEDANIEGIINITVDHDLDIMTVASKVCNLAQGETFDKHVLLYLDAEDYVEVYIYGISSGETCHLQLWGYQMNVP